MVEKPASEIRIDRYNEAKQFTQYLFWDSVEIVSGFYKGHKGNIFKEGNLMNNPKQSTDSIYQEGLVAISYDVLLDLGDGKKELREVETRDIKKI